MSISVNTQAGTPDWFPVSKSVLSFNVTKPADPSSSADITVTVPLEEQWRLLVAKVTLTAGAAVANRELFLHVEDDGGFTIYRMSTGQLVTAGNSLVCSFAAGVGAIVLSAVGTVVDVPLPELYLLPSWVARFTFTNKQAADRLSSAVFLSERIYAPT